MLPLKYTCGCQCIFTGPLDTDCKCSATIGFAMGPHHSYLLFIVFVYVFISSREKTLPVLAQSIKGRGIAGMLAQRPPTSI